MYTYIKKNKQFPRFDSHTDRILLLLPRTRIYVRVLYATLNFIFLLFKTTSKTLFTHLKNII